MTFVQLIDCKTSRYDEMNRLMDTWAEETQGRRTATHALVGRERGEGGHVVEIVEFPSYEDAMKNSALPETTRIYQDMLALCDEAPSFTDLDVVRDEQLNKSAVRHFLLQLCGRDDPEGFRQMFAADYRDHDVANKQADAVGPDGLREATLGYRRAIPDFEFTIEDQVAEGDRVVTRWRCAGTHTGELKGFPPSGRKIEMIGTTTFRFEDGKVKEGWWHWDVLGLMQQIGAIPAPA